MKPILLTKGFVTFVDDEDYDHLMQWKWHVDKGYAKRAHHFKDLNGRWRKKGIFMHRVIMNTPEGIHTDHIDRDRLNNCKFNLRFCTISENNRNRKTQINNKSGYKGVCWKQGKKKWVAKIKVGANEFHIGSFDCPKEAAKAYNEAAVEHHGEFAYLNSID